MGVVGDRLCVGESVVRDERREEFLDMRGKVVSVSSKGERRGDEFEGRVVIVFVSCELGSN